MSASSRTILIVDDEPAFREMLGLMLEQGGDTVTLAADGVEGLRCLATTTFDLVISDLLMPGMDGAEFITAIRRQHPAVRILAMSGGGHIPGTEYLRLARHLGAHAAIGKPFSQEKILGVIGALFAAGTERADAPSPPPG